MTKSEQMEIVKEFFDGINVKESSFFSGGGRDPDRLDEFYDNLKALHKKMLPDIRFMQLIQNFEVWLAEKGVPAFYLEDERTLDYIREFILSEDGD